MPRNILLLIHRNSDDSSLRMKIFLATGEFLPNIPPWSAGTLGTVECRSRSLLGLGTPHSAGKQQCGGRSCGGWSWRHFPPDTATPHLATRTTLRHGHRQQLWCDKWHGACRQNVMEGHDVSTLTWAPSYYDTTLHIVTWSVHVMGQCKCRSGLGPKSSLDTEQTEDLFSSPYAPYYTVWSVQLQVNGMPSERDHWPPTFHRFHPWQTLNDVSRQLKSKVIDRIGRMSGTRKFESECTRVIFTFILFDLFIENVIFCRNYLLHHNDVLSLVAELQKLFHSARRDHLGDDGATGINIFIVY